MTEKEKMLAGELYNASDEQLVKERSYARKMTKRFNQCNLKEKIKLKY